MKLGMKIPERKRKTPYKLVSKLPDDIDNLINRVRYVGSPEHKDAPNDLINPNYHKPRADASICPRDINNIDIVNTWLREAFSKGAISEYMEGDFPRFVWYKTNGMAFQGRLTNRGNGEYKGFPVSLSELPKGIDKIYK